MRLINKSLTESLYQSLKEDFWNPCEYAEMIMNLDVDPKKWNEAKTQEERDAMVRPQLEEFWKKYGKDIKEKRLLRRIYADLEDSNFHTEGRILRDIVSKSSRKSKVNESVSYKDDKNFEDTVKRDFKLFLMDKYGDELYRDVDNDDINEYFTGMFYDIEDEDDLDAANEAEKIIRNEYNCLDSRDSSDDYEYDDGDTNWAAEEASDADERFENRYMSGGNGYTESAKTLKESSNIIWTSETTEDDYDKEELKANQYQDYLNDFDGTFKPMSYEEFLDSDWLYDYLRDYFEEQDEYKEWADFINSYNDVMKNMFDKYRDLAKTYNLTFLLIHHLNKEGKTLGSTGIDGNMNGILTLINNKDNTYTLKIINRDFEEQNLNLIRNGKLEFEIINEDNTELDFNLSVFMRYVIKKKEVVFTPAEMIAELNLLITPSRFGRLLNSNTKRLEKEGIYVELNRTATSRNYKAKFIDPLILEE